jgi:hypothetical protein
LNYIHSDNISRFTATVPTVIQDLGYSSAKAQLLTVPIYVFAMTLVLIFSFWSDRIQSRSPFIIAGFSIAIVGFVAQLAIPHPKYPGLTYGFLFPVAAGLYAPFVSIVCWIGSFPSVLRSVHNLTIDEGNNLAPSSKRAVGMALLISVGNLGGIAGSNIYLAREAPKYQTGFSVSLCTAILACIMAFILRYAFAKANEKKEAFLTQKGADAIRAEYTDQALYDLGDLSPFFRYTL